MGDFVFGLAGDSLNGLGHDGKAGAGDKRLLTSATLHNVLGI